MSTDNNPAGQPYPPQQPYGAQPPAYGSAPQPPAYGSAPQPDPYAQQYAAQPPYGAPQYSGAGNVAPVSTASQEMGAAGVVVAILSFLIPLLGLIMFLVWRKTYPIRARWAGILAIISVVIGIIYQMSR
ncbi:MAG: hypothetical protein FWF75_01725 [Propionibacteriaceae bacterium]|nr:hypothetical protein [Propionibacteriaceae bacterium]